MENILNLSSVLLAIVAFVFFAFFQYYRKKEIVLNDIVTVTYMSGMLPTAVALTLYPFFSSFISIEEMWLQIT